MTSPAFQFYPKEWLSSAKVTMMTLAQEGAYIRLLAYAWLDPDCSIPDDDSALAQLSKVGPDWCKGGYSLVKSCFVPHPSLPGRLVNERLLKEREKQDEWRRKSALGGQKSAAKRWGSKTKESVRVVTECLSNGGNQNLTLQFPVSSLRTAVEIYDAYPKKVGKPAALKAITRALAKVPFDVLLSKTKQFAQARAGDQQFTPHPSTWFNQERYNDDPSTWTQHDNGTSNRNGGRQGFDRNAGTFNEGHSEDYDLRKIQEKRRLQSGQAPGPAAHA